MKYIIMIVLIMLMSSCNGSKSELDTGQNQTVPQNDSVVTFQKLQNEILAPHCIRCHTEFSSEAEVKKEIVPGNADQSHLFEHVRNGSMPPDRGPLSTAELEVVRMYIEGLVP